MVVWFHGFMASWCHGLMVSLVERLLGCKVAWLSGGMFACLHALHGCMVCLVTRFYCLPGSIRWHAWQPAQQDSKAEARSSL
jgi:hypothetical protein